MALAAAALEGEQEGQGLPCQTSRIPALARSSGCTWGAPGAKGRVGGMVWVGDGLLSPPPTSLAGWELPSRLVALSISYKNVLVMYWFW